MRTRDEPGKSLIAPALRNGRLSAGTLIAAAALMLGGSFVALMAAQFLMPDSYSWLEHTISESGAQGLDYAWLVTVGVLLTSSSVFILSVAAGEGWNRRVKAAFLFYAVALVGSAFLQEAPWEEIPHNETEAYLHTFFTFWAGVGFAFGILFLSRSRERSAKAQIIFDWVMIGTTALIPLVMLSFLDIEGLLQRVLVLIGYAWWFNEIYRMRSGRSPYWE